MKKLTVNIYLKGEGVYLTPYTNEKTLNRYLKRYPKLKEYVRETDTKKTSSKKSKSS